MIVVPGLSVVLGQIPNSNGPEARRWLGGRGRSQVRHALGAPGFLVKHLGQVMPRPIRFASSIAIPIVNTNPNVTQKMPSNVRQAMVSP